MTSIKPFSSIRPHTHYASDVAALPYDVHTREEAYQIVKGNPLSFLSIDSAETNFNPEFDPYALEVYTTAAALLEKHILNGIYLQEDTECFYLYELIMNGRSLTGIVGCASVDDYQNGIIKKHENTRIEKEIDRTRHIDVCNAHTGPIFLTYRTNKDLYDIICKQKTFSPIYDFTTEDGVRHIIYRICSSDTQQKIQDVFAQIDSVYIADGHHRAAAAANVCMMRKRKHPAYTGDEAFQHFLAVFFAEEELQIMPYHRLVKDLNGLDTASFFTQLRTHFEITPLCHASHPSARGSFTMLLDGTWYLCHIKSEQIPDDPVAALDVSLLQDYVLRPILGIKDPRNDTRIDFVGGIRGLKELEKRCRTDCKVAFAMYPTSIHELFAVADAGLLMPPKSTWFEPKPRSGLFIHKI